MANNPVKKKNSFYTILGKIGDILLWPVLIISLFSSFFMLVQRNQNKVTSIFGYSFVNVLSGSMVDEGFNIRDTVITKRVNKIDIKLGDVIAFYEKSSTKDFSNMTVVIEYTNITTPMKYDESNITDNNIDLTTIEINNSHEKELVEEAQKNKVRIKFHRVIGIYLDADNNLYFKTKGSNNQTADSITYADLLVGKYVYTPVFVRRAVTFCASPIGMILLVCFPLSLLVLMQCLSLIEQISIISLEKSLISGKLSYKDEAIKKDLHSDQIELYNKAYYYYITPKEQKEEVKKFLWEDLLEVPILPDNKKEELNIMQNAIAQLDVSDEAYWDYWIENSKGKTNKKQLIKYKNQLLSEQEQPRKEQQLIKEQKQKKEEQNALKEEQKPKNEAQDLSKEEQFSVNVETNLTNTLTHSQTPKNVKNEKVSKKAPVKKAPKTKVPKKEEK